MIVRKANEGDKENVFGLIRELEGESLPFDGFEKVYAENLEDPGVAYFVCEDGGELVGFGSLHVQLLLHHCSPVAEIEELIVRPAVRGKGAGKKLFRALALEARSRGCSLIEVCCNKKRVNSHGFYERCGMKNSHYKFTLELD